MPNIFKKDGYRFYFYSADGTEPMHIHVEYGSGMAKFWLSPVHLAYSVRLNASEIRRARILVEEHVQLITEKWHEYFSGAK